MSKRKQETRRRQIRARYLRRLKTKKLQAKEKGKSSAVVQQPAGK